MTDHSTIAARCITAGIDVAKAKLDVAIHPSGEHYEVANTKAGFKQLDAILARHDVSRVGFEASGGYERGLLAHVRGQDVAAACLQPGQVKAFAKSRLRRAKSDRIDAALIAAFTASLETMPALADAAFEAYGEHLTFIEQIEEAIARAKTHLETTRQARLRAFYEREVARLKLKRAAEIARLLMALRNNPSLSAHLDLLVSMPGVAERTALAILVRMPEIGSLSREQAAALAGLAPFDDDSGKRRGPRHVAGGRERLRKSLFMAAFAATRWNPDLKAFYRRLIAAGKHHTLAVVACARKLIILANAIIARQTPWSPKTMQN